jgi:hypothetical protein
MQGSPELRGRRLRGQENGSHGDKPIPRARASQIMQIVSPMKRITLLLFIFRRTG